jgi:competence protein ComEA
MKRSLTTAFIAATVMLLVAATLLAAALVDLNLASQKELEALKGVGPATAKKIMAARPYASVDELSKAGLSAKQIASLKPMVTVGAARPRATTPVNTAKPRASAATPSLTGPVDLNSASEKDLEALKGVGPATAKKIIAARPYASVDQLSKAGLSAKQVATIRPQVVVSGAAGSSPAIASGPRSTAARSSSPPSAVDLNTASMKDLEALKGIGPATAKKIVAARPYRSVDELTRAGVSAKVISEIRPYVTASAPVVAASPAPAPRVNNPPPAPAPMTPSLTPTPSPAPTSTASGSRSPKLPPGHTVNINTASKEELDALPDIGPVKAQAIIDGRPYAKIEDVMKVKGIKQGIFNKIKDWITVD